ncbi:cytochrome P450 [Aspergillus clavatus NRRL 1]|uniref:Cytochrome P450 monooxygenase patH n=1 Tax=Aspergillus clavatus (strain ATCC 1007 / CBS 513.65 / DSM 816 / NCTC 3887 / NRRL 1 / QM 1276 / 107) TaxID=344612 RepID=PATH_ASPCL|nr:Cytochrome P450 oxidoreductase, putative [Aspergillus clavatus NRRL 1]A1CFL5.1 RecName: Full=Cytochrome P450 monooxygenase patH; AltName: Full=Patulin synthesis protein H; AltName: Full=m-cresol hydrolase [Aspergillus clavatus NRRL 1]EAW11664.1 Cytochrome P450 oxidoreductase, putative [Aspergillus clavatus NRRL 1]
MEPMLLLILVAAVVLLFVRWAFVYGHRTSNMPKGPPTLPFIGNIHQIPTQYTHIKFTEWAAKYGGLYMLKVGNGNMAVVTDRRLVKEVVDRKSGIYSHRPHSFVSHELITKGNHLLVMHYGDQWRTFRRLIHQHLMESMVDSQHVKIVNAEAIQLVRDYLVDPEHHMAHPKRFSNSITNSIVFGIRTADRNGSNMKRLYKLMEEWSEIMETGATPPVDLFPWMKMLPQWMFSNYVNRAKAIGVQMETLYTDILNKVIKRRNGGQNLGTFMDRVLDGQEKNDLPWHQLAFIGGVLMEGGSDTSSSLTIAIVQALILNPAVQKKAHAEIDAVVGSDRSPVWEDLEKLPYINMIIKEGHRWRPILPLCFPHALGEDDWVDGKLLPKGTVVVINTWGMHMDPSQPDDPAAFIPERYANHPQLAPEYAAGKWENRDHYGYGVGRRICPGIHLAERNMFLAIAKLLWAFEFQRGEGKIDSDPVTGYHNGFLYCAKDYPCRPVVRNKTIRATIEREFATATKEVFSQFTEG